jgi:hypothetical protein
MRAAAWAMVVLGSMLSAAARAQPEASLEAVVRVEPDTRGCVTKAALQARVRHWLDASTALDDVAVEVRAAARPPAFVVLRSGSIIAERRFPVLPTQCRDRLDALAIAIALALENAAHTSTSAQREGASDAPSRAVIGADSGRPLAPLQPLPPRVPSAPPSEAPSRTPIRPRPFPTPEPIAGPAPTPPPTAAPVPTPVPIAARPVARAPTRAPTPTPAPTLDRTPPVSLGTSNLALRLQAGIALIGEVLPAPALALQAGGELIIGPSHRFSLALDGLITSQTDNALAGAESQSQLFAGRALACWAWPVGALVAESCAGLALGAVNAAGNGYSIQDLPTTLLWVAGVVRFAVRYPRQGAFSARLAADGFVNAERPRLLVQTADGSVVASGPGIWGGAGTLALCISFQ